MACIEWQTGFWIVVGLSLQFEFRCDRQLAINLMAAPLGSRDFTFRYQIRMKWIESNTKQSSSRLLCSSLLIASHSSVSPQSFNSYFVCKSRNLLFCSLLLSVPFLIHPSSRPVPFRTTHYESNTTQLIDILYTFYIWKVLSKISFHTFCAFNDFSYFSVSKCELNSKWILDSSKKTSQNVCLTRL